MKKSARITAGALAVWMAFLPLQASADWMQDFYSSAGAAANITHPQAIASQNVVGYSGGGLSWRVPNKTFQPVAITGPSLKSGCGGIDAYLGAYSFPNKDAFVQALRNFGQAAVGYFFSLALRSMAPEIAATLDVINDLAQRVNQFGMNSCSAATKLVDTIAGDTMKGMVHDSSSYARKVGTYVDQFDAMMGIKDGGYAKALEQKYQSIYNKDSSSVTKADMEGDKPPVEVNVLWYALGKMKSADLSDDEKYLVMSLVGPTLIIRSGPSDDGTDTTSHNDGRPRSIEFDDLLGELQTNSTYRVLKCDETVKCLGPTVSTESHLGFSGRSMRAIQAIQTRITSRTSTALTADDDIVIRLSSVPLYRAAAMSTGTGISAAIAGTMLDDLADYAAVDAAMKFVNYYLVVTDNALSVVGPQLPANYAPEVAKIHARITDIREQMHKKVNQFYAAKGNPFQKLEQLDRAERFMYANLNTMLAANARFGKRN